MVRHLGRHWAGKVQTRPCHRPRGSSRTPDAAAPRLRPAVGLDGAARPIAAVAADATAPAAADARQGCPLQTPNSLLATAPSGEPSRAWGHSPWAKLGEDHGKAPTAHLRGTRLGQECQRAAAAARVMVQSLQRRGSPSPLRRRPRHEGLPPTQHRDSPLKPSQVEDYRTPGVPRQQRVQAPAACNPEAKTRLGRTKKGQSPARQRQGGLASPKREWVAAPLPGHCAPEPTEPRLMPVPGRAALQMNPEQREAAPRQALVREKAVQHLGQRQVVS